MSAENLPLVTVICNCYNHAAYITEALYSVVNQSYTNIELIVINNGSSDDSGKTIADFIKLHPSVIYIDLEKTTTHNKAFNQAFAVSSGDFLIDLSGDDRLLPDCVKNQVGFFMTQPHDVGLIFGNATVIDEKGNSKYQYFPVDEDKKVLDRNLFKTTYKSLLAGGLCMCSVSAMMRRYQFDILKGYDERLVFEDLDYWLRLSYEYKIAFLDKFLVEKRELTNSLGSQFHKKNDFAKKINNSLFIIYKDAIKRNNISENRCLLKRIHYSMEQCYKSKNWKGLFRFSTLELCCRKRIYFR